MAYYHPLRTKSLEYEQYITKHTICAETVQSRERNEIFKIKNNK